MRLFNRIARRLLLLSLTTAILLFFLFEFILHHNLTNPYVQSTTSSKFSAYFLAVDDDAVAAVDDDDDDDNNDNVERPHFPLLHARLSTPYNPDLSVQFPPRILECAKRLGARGVEENDVQWLVEQPFRDTQEHMKQCVVPEFSTLVFNDESNDELHVWGCVNGRRFYSFDTLDWSLATPLPLNQSTVIIPNNVEQVFAYCSNPIDSSAYAHAHSRFSTSPSASSVTAAVNHRRLHNAEAQHLRRQAHANMSIVFLLIDSLSHLHFQRSMREVRRWLLKYDDKHPTAELFEFEQYQTIDWSSPGNQNPLHTGIDCNDIYQHIINTTAEELTRKQGTSLAISCDELLLDAAYTRAGYVTSQLCDFCQKDFFHKVVDQVALDCAEQLKVVCGNRSRFVDVIQPSMHACWKGLLAPYGRFYHTSDRCFPPRETIGLWRRFLQRFHATSPPVYLNAQLLFVHHSARADHASSLDGPLLEFLLEIDVANTFLVLLSDHGLHFGPHLDSEQGLLEHRLPLLMILAPRRPLLDPYPQLYQSMRLNQQRLVTAFDIYRTMRHVLTLSRTHDGHESPPPQVVANRISLSLFTPIPENRTCKDAGIKDMYCICDHRWELVSSYDVDARQSCSRLASEVLVVKINSHININEYDCPIVELKKVLDCSFHVESTDSLPIYWMRIRFISRRNIIYIMFFQRIIDIEQVNDNVIEELKAASAGGGSRRASLRALRFLPLNDSQSIKLHRLSYLPPAALKANIPPGLVYLAYCELD